MKSACSVMQFVLYAYVCAKQRRNMTGQSIINELRYCRKATLTSDAFVCCLPSPEHMFRGRMNKKNNRSVILLEKINTGS